MTRWSLVMVTWQSECIQDVCRLGLLIWQCKHYTMSNYCFKIIGGKRLNLRQWQDSVPRKAPRRMNSVTDAWFSQLNRTIMALMINTSINTLTASRFLPLSAQLWSPAETVLRKSLSGNSFLLKCALLYEETMWIITGMSHLPNVGLTACVCWPVIRLHMKHKQMHNISLYSTERLILFPVRVMLRTRSERPRLSVRFSPLTWASVSEGH